MSTASNPVRIAALAVAMFAVLATIQTAQSSPKGPAKAAKPAIAITHAPNAEPGESSFGDIAGLVKNAPKGSRVVLYSLGDTWYVQPYADAPFTSIGKDGRFSATIHGGYEFAALLVKAGYQPPATTSELPRVGGSILAIAHAKRK